jgi:hypothetical protein
VNRNGNSSVTSTRTNYFSVTSVWRWVYEKITSASLRTPPSREGRTSTAANEAFRPKVSVPAAGTVRPGTAAAHVAGDLLDVLACQVRMVDGDGSVNQSDPRFQATATELHQRREFDQVRWAHFPGIPTQIFARAEGPKAKISLSPRACFFRRQKQTVSKRHHLNFSLKFPSGIHVHTYDGIHRVTGTLPLNK